MRKAKRAMRDHIVLSVEVYEEGSHHGYEGLERVRGEEVHSSVQVQKILSIFEYFQIPNQ